MIGDSGLILGLLVKAAQRIEEQARDLRPRTRATLGGTRSKLAWYVQRADAFLDRADTDVRSSFDIAEARARVRVAQTIGRTIVELEKLRREIVEKQ